jgi:hypothetical protein
MERKSVAGNETTTNLIQHAQILPKLPITRGRCVKSGHNSD